MAWQKESQGYTTKGDEVIYGASVSRPAVLTLVFVLGLENRRALTYDPQRILLSFQSTHLPYQSNKPGPEIFSLDDSLPN